jgi:hypothetical protein
MYMTTEPMPGRQAGDSPLQGGSVESYGDRGLWVPDGMTAHEIMVGAEVLERHFGVEHYEARSMVRRVLDAIRDTPSSARQSIG